MNWTLLEVFSSILALVTVGLLSRSIVHGWLIGVLVAMTYSWISYNSGDYAITFLSAFVIYISCVGWVTWRKKFDDEYLPITKARPPVLWYSAGSSVVITLVYNLIMSTEVGAGVVPSVIVFSLCMAVTLLMVRCVEGWIALLIGSLVAIPEIWSSSYITSAICAGVGALSLWTWVDWNEIVLEESEEDSLFLEHWA